MSEWANRVGGNTTQLQEMMIECKPSNNKRDLASGAVEGDDRDVKFVFFMFFMFLHIFFFRIPFRISLPTRFLPRPSLPACQPTAPASQHTAPAAQPPSLPPQPPSLPPKPPSLPANHSSLPAYRPSRLSCPEVPRILCIRTCKTLQFKTT